MSKTIEHETEAQGMCRVFLAALDEEIARREQFERSYDYEKMEAAHPCHGCRHREYCDLQNRCQVFANGKMAYLEELHIQGVPGY